MTSRFGFDYTGISLADAKAHQLALAKHLPGSPLPKSWQPICIVGLDVSNTRFERDLTAAVVILSWPALAVIEVRVQTSQAVLPYVPGYLAFREVPALLPLLETLPEPSLLMVDGHGRIHPRRCGLACHLGLETHRPAIGVAKRQFIGDPVELDAEPGSTQEIRQDGEILGLALRSRGHANPIYLSVGTQVSLDEAHSWVKATLTGHRLPLPTRLAHIASGAARRGEDPTAALRQVWENPPKAPGT